MLGFDFNYYECETIEEAVTLYTQLSNENKKVLYFCGGTEIITFGERGSITFNAVISIKNIPELNIMATTNDSLIIGASKTLSYIEETSIYPLLSKTCTFVGDHTSRNKITIGGNLCGKLPFKNAVIPFLITDTKVIIANETGLREEDFLDVYNNGYKLPPSDLVVQFKVPKYTLHQPYYSKKIRKVGDAGYPLIALSLVNDNGYIKSGFSNVCHNAFTSEAVNAALNEQSLSFEARAKSAVEAIPCEILTDIQGSAAYRKFVLQEQLENALNQLDGDFI